MDVNQLAADLGVSPATIAKLAASAVTVLIVLVTRHLILRAVQRRFEEAWVSYRARKITAYTATILMLVIVAWIWIDAFNDLPTFLGLVSAGLAIALADVLKNVAGWVYVLSRRPFRVGDRVEVDGTKGDVVDIRLFRFSLMEVGGWVDAEQSTGRLVHIPNAVLFTSQVANYTEGFAYVWHEIPVLITFESDRRRARRVLEDVLATHAPELEQSAGRVIRETARSYHIKIGALTPIVYLTVKDSGVLLTARYLVDVRQQRGIQEAIWTELLDRFDREPDIGLAYPTVRTFFEGPIMISDAEASDPGNPVP